MLTTMFRSSAFWTAVVTAIGGVIVQFVPAWKPLWEQMILPAIVYIVARLLGNTAKAVIPPTS